MTIAVLSDKPPNKLVKLDERLRSRFGWNMIAEIAPPDYETRISKFTLSTIRF